MNILPHVTRHTKLGTFRKGVVYTGLDRDDPRVRQSIAPFIRTDKNPAGVFDVISDADVKKAKMKAIQAALPDETIAADEKERKRQLRESLSQLKKSRAALSEVEAERDEQSAVIEELQTQIEELVASQTALQEQLAAATKKGAEA